MNQSFVTGANSPSGVAVDGQHIYWANTFSNAIGEANLDGSAANQAFITGADGPSGVAVDGQHIYWPNNGTNTIGEANLDGTAVNQSLTTTGTFPFGLAVSVSVVQVTPAAVPAFQSTPQGTLSAPSTVTVSNSGQRAVAVSGLSFTGADPGVSWSAQTAAWGRSLRGRAVS